MMITLASFLQIIAFLAMILFFLWLAHLRE